MPKPNVLLQDWTGPYGGVPPWDRVDAADFPEAFEIALAERHACISGLAPMALKPQKRRRLS